MTLHDLVSITDPYNPELLEQLFEQCFYARFKTRLCGGASEPYYQPADSESEDHRIFYREDFFASALHEVAHWCIAGQERRQQPDFGYWYVGEGRSDSEQRAFEAAECKPQAIELLFSRAAGFAFRPSLDQHNSEECYAQRSARFVARVEAEVERYLSRGLPSRAAEFIAALDQHFQGLP